MKISSINSSDDFKNNVSEVIDEIKKRYDKVEELVETSNTLHDSVISSMLSASKNIKAYRLNNTKYETFQGIKGLNKKAIEYTNDMEIQNIEDRYGEKLGIHTNANVSPNSLELSPTLLQSAFNQNNVNNVTCSISEQFGENLINIETYTDINNIVDLSTSSYWCDEIITERKFKKNTTKDGYNLKDYGAFCEVRLKLESVRRINSLTIQTISKYPMYVEYIKYTQTDNEYEDKKVLTDKEHIFSNNSSISINFDSTIVKNIYIGITQTHYEKTTIPISGIIADNIVPKAIKEVSKLITGYRYEYGLYNVLAEYKDYSNIGVYQTKDIFTTGSINKLYVEDVVDSPKINGESYLDNEYYITTLTSPNWKDWKPIFPINSEKIECEKLINLGGVCNFRFLAEEVYAIKRNGKEIPEIEYKLKLNENKAYGVSIANFNPNLVYTVSYKPVKESKVLNLGIDNTLPTINNEVIKCDENNSYLLAAYPYQPIKNNVIVEILDTAKGKIYKQQDGKITNTTGTKEFVFNKNKFQYYIDGNRIFFNQNMDTKYTIKIKYNTLNARYKLKVIMRRNTNKTREITQTINKINVISENI
ncbi:MAG: hypothetical protein ACRDBY_01090 [Cetobacterium sp.]